jgi:hypothetical protein
LIFCFYFYRFDLSQKCDFLIQDVPPSPQRLKIVDLTAYWFYGSLGFLIPAADETANINAVVKPFQWPVRNTLDSKCLTCSYSTSFVYQSTGMVGTRCIHWMRHCSFAFNPALLGLSINNR